MPQNKGSHRLDVVRHHEVPALYVGTRAGRARKEDRGTRRGTEFDQILEILHSVRGGLARREAELDHVVEYLLLEVHRGHLTFGSGDLLDGSDGFDGRGIGVGDASHDGLFLLARGVADVELHGETVELCLREWVGPMELDWILGGEHHERGVEGVGLSRDRDLAFLHRLEQRGLNLGRRAVDLVGEDDVGEDGAFVDLELTTALIEDRRADDVRGQQVRSELDATEVRMNRLRQSPHHECLGKSGQPFQEDVPPRKQRDQ